MAKSAKSVLKRQTQKIISIIFYTFDLKIS